MGGSGGGGGGKAPQQAQQLDMNAIMGAANAGAGASVAAQMKSLIENYPRMERQQLGTIGNISNILSEDGGELFNYELVKKGNAKRPDEWRKVSLGKADPNLFTAKARMAVDSAMAQRDPMLSQAQKLAASGDTVSQLALQNYLSSGDRTFIEQELQRQAESELALGRSLSAEEMRDATQTARASMAARGLGSSSATTAAEILNRDSYAQARESARRNFAASTNQMLMQNEMSKRDQSAQQAALGGQLAANAANLYQGTANLGLAGGQAYMQVDPKMRAMQPAITMGSGIQSTMANMITPTYTSAMGLAGNIASFNAGMLDSRYNAWANQQGARMAANASRQAGMMGMFGGIGQGLMSAGGAIGSAAMMAPAITALSDKREKTEIKPLGKSGSVLGLKMYSYKYKGDDKKRIGVMAQDVQKVLPEAVEEVEYKGKKRLAIKPTVIGAALAEELAAQPA